MSVDLHPRGSSLSGATYPARSPSPRPHGALVRSRFGAIGASLSWWVPTSRAECQRPGTGTLCVSKRPGERLDGPAAPVWFVPPLIGDLRSLRSPWSSLWSIGSWRERDVERGCAQASIEALARKRDSQPQTPVNTASTPGSAAIIWITRELTAATPLPTDRYRHVSSPGSSH